MPIIRAATNLDRRAGYDLANAATARPLLPSQVSGIWGWYRADDIAGADNDAVATWADTSGGAGGDLTQGTGGAQPTLKLNLAGGHSAVRFAAGDSIEYTPGAALAAPHTLIVTQWIPPGTGYRFSIASPFSVRAHSAGAMGYAAGTYPCAGDGQLAVWSFVTASTGTKVWRNGSPLPSVSALGSIAHLGFGTDAAANNFRNFDGDIYEIAVYSAALTDDERAAVEQGMCARYGITWTPGTNPGTITETTANSQDVRIHTPPGYNSANPTPLLLVSHGGGSSQNVVTLDNFVRVADVARELGFIVAASNEHTNEYGQANAIADAQALYNHIATNVGPIERVVTAGESLGGLTSLQMLRTLPRAVGWFGIAAVCADTVSPATSQSVTNPITASTAGYAGKRFLAISSTSDATVSSTNHSDAMMSYVAGVAREATTLRATGGHIDASHYNRVAVAAFLWRCLGDPIA